MLSQVAPELVMVSGAGLGMGRTTLARNLARTARFQFIRDEALLFDRPEFDEVADRFRRGLHPDAAHLQRAYVRLANAVRESSQACVIDATFIDVAEDLRWAMANDEHLHDFSRDMRTALGAFDVVILYLEGDLAEGIRRRERERGRAWFSGYDVPVAGESWKMSLERIEARFSSRRDRVLRAFEAGGWELSMLDANRAEADVLGEALQVMNNRS